MEVRKTYYFMPHAYHHFIAEVVEVRGPDRFWCKKVIRIQSCRRGWTEFFQDGMKDDTVYTHFPDGEIVSTLKFEWNHPIPTLPKSKR